MSSFRAPSRRLGSGSKTPTSVLVKRIVRSFLYLVAWIFLILVVIGNVSKAPVIRNTYFMEMNLSNIVPLSVSSNILVNSIARSIGLHDFYTVGLWNYCEGYFDTGVTYCSKPQTLFAFNPLEIIMNELLSGSTSMYIPSCKNRKKRKFR